MDTLIAAARCRGCGGNRGKRIADSPRCTHSREAAGSRFCLHLRHRVHVKNILAQCENASEKATPQSTASPAPLTQGRFFRCALRIFKYANYRCPVRNKGINHSISHPLIQRKICIVLAGSGSFPVSAAASILGYRNKCIRSAPKRH